MIRGGPVAFALGAVSDIVVNNLFMLDPMCSWSPEVATELYPLIGTCPQRKARRNQYHIGPFSKVRRDMQPSMSLFSEAYIVQFPISLLYLT